MNNKTKECFPSLKTISEISGYSIPIIRDSIKLLQKEGWITVKKFGRQQKYYFRNYQNFEPFSFDFIRKKDLSIKEKTYIVAIQQYMFKDTPGYGKISYTEKELANKINISESKLLKYDKDLQDKGFLTIITDKKKENRFFKLTELGQNIVFALQDHEDRISEMENSLNDEVKSLKKLLIKMGKSNK